MTISRKLSAISTCRGRRRVVLTGGFTPDFSGCGGTAAGFFGGTAGGTTAGLEGASFPGAGTAAFSDAGAFK